MSFDDYYRNVYLPVHTKPLTRLCHLIGNVATVAWVALCLTVLHPLWLLAAPFVIYPFAIPSHYLFEGCKPAVLGGKDDVPYQPLKAKYSDWRMCFEWLTGKI